MPYKTKTTHTTDQKKISVRLSRGLDIENLGRECE